MTTTINFTDHGQDFLTWTLDEKGHITDSQPAQADIWCGKRVLNCQRLRAGGKVTYYCNRDNEIRTVKYPIESVS